MPIRVVPLTSGFMLAGITGVIFGSFYLYPKTPTWGFTILLFSTILIIASFVSMTYAPLESEDSLQIGRKSR